MAEGGTPKDQYTQQLVDEELDSWGEGARREFEDQEPPKD